MKKINILFYVVGIVCFLMAGYIIYDEFFAKDATYVNFSEEEEIVVINDKLSEIGSPLGWIIIVDGISNQDRNGNYVISYDKDLLDNYEYRQLFVMEYILSYNNYDIFTVLDMDGNVIEDNPTSEFTYAYVEYDEFNNYYKSLFSEDFDHEKAKKGNTSYDNTHVYYDNRRAGSNGVYVSMMQATSVEYKDEMYKAEIVVTYSTRASELIGVSSDIAVLKYTKDIDENIILESFSLKDR